ncbi:unnamed protein product [Bursaphelenchus xylophilus]|uniref:(pine wood nematode) hypothetical protein n=1 Tax=Bursaphelenchus xylophilus TaxID=6326 RepID=A0A1I7RMK1_BURXY|nr:unnamed protein product [Bursaphelenchus xylophilus]CAG9125743.1 unnamed protein product [Bursaphelenchus xylophilus]
MELDVQGLRCVAVIYVVLFHLWPTVFINGFLGVDIFFVISGYLMQKILSSKEYTVQNVITFYFRRIRRILPTYLTVLIVVTVAATNIFYNQEFKGILRELMSAATFTSNLFNLPPKGYFTANNAFPLFLHTWSLSVEIQFYLIVPGIYALYDVLRKREKYAGPGVIAAMAVLSFGYQVLNEYNVNIAHMSLLSRIWQFLLGFLIESIKPENNYEKLPLEEDEPAPFNIYNHYYAIKNGLAAALLVQLAYPPTYIFWLNRLLCTSIAALFIMVKGNSFVENRVAVYVGDVSYSLYLIHWPLIIMSKYVGEWSMTGPKVQEGVFILQASLLLSIPLENGFKKVSSHIDNWPKLLKLLTLIYAILMSTALFMFSQQADLTALKPIHTGTNKIPTNNMSVMERSLYFYNHRTNLTLTHREAMEYNVQVHSYFFDFIKECRQAHINKYGKTELTYTEFACQVEGTGDKEIAIVGNSFARDLFFGVWPQMKHMYKRLSMYCVPCVIPFYVNPETNETDWDFIGLIERWDRPIDILIIRHTYYQLHAKPKAVGCPIPAPDYVEKHMLNQMQAFYDRVSKRAKLVVIGYSEHESELEPQKLPKVLDENRVHEVNFNYTLNRQIAAKVNKVVQSVKCDNCIKVDFMKALCDFVTDTCYAATMHGIMVWLDYIHVTIYGAILETDVLIDELNKHGIQ